MPCAACCAAELNFPGHKIRKDCSDGDPDFESDFTVLSRTHCAAALTESLFYDNAEDLRFATLIPNEISIFASKDRTI